MATARKLLKYETKAYYLATGQQITIRPANMKLENILNREGLKLLKLIKEKLKDEQKIDTLKNCALVCNASGMWIPDDKHPFHDKKLPILLRSNNNLFIISTDNQMYITSTILLFSTRESWAYTITGSLYKIYLPEVPKDPLPIQNT